MPKRTTRVHRSNPDSPSNRQCNPYIGSVDGVRFVKDIRRNIESGRAALARLTTPTRCRAALELIPSECLLAFSDSHLAHFFVRGVLGKYTTLFSNFVRGCVIVEHIQRLGETFMSVLVRWYLL